MQHHVRFQIPLSVETFVAYIAVELFLACVYDNVALVQGSIREYTPAEFTRVLAAWTCPQLWKYKEKWNNVNIYWTKMTTWHFYNTNISLNTTLIIYRGSHDLKSARSYDCFDLFVDKLTTQLIKFNTLTHDRIPLPALGGIDVLILMHSKSHYKSIKFSFWVSVQ